MYLAAAALLATTAGTPALADGSFSGAVALTSDYRFRGISNSDRNPALQPTITWTHDSGIYLGAWASNIDFNDADDSTIELDLYGGYATTAGDFGLDFGIVYYGYPDGASTYDYVEGIIKVSREFEHAKWTAQVAYSPDFFGETGTGLYFATGLSVPIVDWLSASANVGHQEIEDGVDYTHWDAGLTASYERFSFDVRYVDTDLSNAECGGTDWCESGVVATVTFSFST
jgi:uncharacterized protein (TIGR02001 family)